MAPANRLESDLLVCFFLVCFFPPVPRPLQEHKFWEDSFRVYERGVAVFKYPHVKDIWQARLMRQRGGLNESCQG